MQKQKTDHSPAPAFTWGVKSSDLAHMQGTLPDPMGGCSDCGCGTVRFEDRKKKVRPAKTAAS